MESNVKDFNSIFKMNEMVKNFENFNSGSEFKVLPWLNQSNFAKYINLSITEILGPQFEKFATNWDYDSDGAYTSDKSEIYSSGDEFQDSGSCRSCSPYDRPNYQSAPLDFTKRTLEEKFKSRQVARPCYTDRVMTWSEILRRKYKEDGYTSSDFDSALDLRIQRKKTPPATTTDALPAWVFCTRYSDRPSAGPRAKRRRHTQRHRKARTAFKDAQVRVLNIEFDKDPYLSESRRHQLAEELDLDADNVKVWFQNKRAKLKKDGLPHPLAVELHAQGLYNHKLTSNTVQ